jgi:hypothetical protein
MTDAVNANIVDHLNRTFSADDVRELSHAYSRYGFVKIRNIVSDDMRRQVRAEVLRLLSANAERRDLNLVTTGNTPRRMSVVRSEFIAYGSELIPTIARSEQLLDFLGKIAGERIFPDVSEDEEYLITRQERQGDTHGWHWGDYSFALIWLIETPPISHGGMLQCVPHTTWDKENPRINELLCAHPINTYGFTTGDIYFLRTDTTLHRTVPLTEDGTRIILNMTWASAKDLDGELKGNDRWWEDQRVAAAVATEGATESG